MLSFKLAARRFFRQGEHTTSKLLTLTLGLTVSILLLSIVIFQRSYERDYPNYDRIHIVKTNVSQQVEGEDSKNMVASQVSGAIAPGMQAEIPEVELATRTTSVGEIKLISEDKKAYKVQTLLTEHNFLDMFGIELIAGVRDSVLYNNKSCLISESLARKMGGDVLGKQVFQQTDLKMGITIEGVFRDLPHNSSIQGDVLFPITWMPDESLNNWVGNDRYKAYVRLYPGVNPESLDDAIYEMQKRHQDLEMIRKAGCSIRYNMSASTQRGVAERIRQIPGVQGTAFMFNLPSWMLSSNHVLDEEGKAVFTFADFASADTRFSRLLDLKFLEGGGFTPNSTSSDVIISKRFAEQLHLHKIIKGGSIVGSSFRITGRSEGNNVVRVQGVYEDMTLNSLDQNDLRPQLISFYPDYGNVILISIGANTQKVRTAIMEILKKEFGADKVALESMEDDRFIALYAVRSFRDGIVMGSIIALLIALIGILGYVSNEINRRRKELAIRKINGAGVTDILRLFILDISKISIPAVIIGLLAAYFLNDLWQMGFAVHAPLKVVDLFLCLLAILLLIFVTVIIDCIRIARESPIKSIQNE